MLDKEEKKKVHRGQTGMWAKQARELMKYRDEHGHCNVPQRDGSLGWWVHRQRKFYKKWIAGKESSRMTPERVKILTMIGFEWDASHMVGGKKNDEVWMEQLEKLKHYKEEHGDCLVPRKYASNPQLGNWVVNQRTQYQLMQQGKHTQLNEERVQQLEDLDFVWQVKRGQPRH